jgi:hypothetical protein
MSLDGYRDEQGEDQQQENDQGEDGDEVAHDFSSESI